MGHIQSFDHPMTVAEIRGFRLACACMVQWGQEIEGNGISLGGPAEPMMPRHKLMQHTGRMIRYVAETLDLTVGQPNSVDQRALPAS